ncbi:MAG TPA: Coq4 family protein [Polyangiales bacterium]|nr:Coq4 family protein [Polyangiales bacterium]
MSLSEGELAGTRAFRDAAQLVRDPHLVARVEHALLERPWFAALYARRRDPAALGGIGANTRLGAAVRDFRSHYELVPSFFPASLAAEATPLELAAWLLARDHDLYHVLCEYETSDHDEIALQSFLCAQAPCVFGCFVALLLQTSDLDAARYKHLRDLLDAEPDPAAAARGKRARPLIAENLLHVAERPLAELRRQLGIAPARRGAPDELRNSCNGKAAGPYFEAGSQEPRVGIKRSRPHIRVRCG